MPVCSEARKLGVWSQMAWVGFLAVWFGANDFTFRPQDSRLQTRDDNIIYLLGWLED